MLSSASAQESLKRITLKEGLVSNIKYKDLNLNTLLQVYDNESAGHLSGDIYLRIDSNDETITDFYIDNSKKEYYTKIYKNYLFTFTIENNIKYLIIEESKFGKTFALSSNDSSIIVKKDDFVEIEITDIVQEWGYDAPPEDSDRSYFSDVHYTLKVKTGDIVKKFSFYSSELKGHLSFDLGNYSILILSDIHKDSSSLIEMRVNKKEE